MKKYIFSFLIFCLIFSLTISVKAEDISDFPTLPFNYNVTFAPGGLSDVTARIQQPYLEEVMGVRVINSYTVGGGGSIGWSELVNAPSDGYHSAGFNIPHIILQPLIREDAGYETDQINPVAIFQFTPTALIVRPDDSRFDDLESFVEYAKENPGSLSVGGSGSYTGSHIGSVKFEAEADISFNYIPFGGTGEAMTAFYGEHIDALYDYASTAIVYREQMKALAVAHDERLEQMPEVPTFMELGFDFTESAYRGIAVPPGTSEEKIDILANAIQEVNAIPEFQEQMHENALGLMFLGPEESKQLILEKQEEYENVLENYDLE